MPALLPKQVKETPPSARLVYTALDVHGPLERQELIDETGVAERTLNSALATLRESDLIEIHKDPFDSRRRVYTTTDS